MIGHTSLIDLRMQGYKPRAVFVYALDADQQYTRYSHPEHQIFLGGLPVIDVPADENVSAMDFRCVAALTVHLSGEPSYRVMEVLDRMMEFNPECIYAVADGSLLHWSPATGFKEIGGAQ
nr:hypothetical protein [Pseudomonas sp.]